MKYKGKDIKSYWFWRIGIVVWVLMLAGGMVQTVSAEWDINSSKTLNIFGDSFSSTTTTNGVTYANKYPSLILSQVGYTGVNTATDSNQIADEGIIGKIYKSNVSQNNVSVLLLGYNDERYFGDNSSGLHVYNETLMSALLYLSLPNASIINATDTSITYKGTWGTVGIWGRKQNYTHTAGSNATFTAYGTQIFIGSVYNIDIGDTPTNKNFNVTVDDVLYGSYSPFDTIKTKLGRAYHPFVVRITGLSDTTHTVKLNYNGSGGVDQNVWIDWIAAKNSSTPLNDVYLGNTVRMTSSGYLSNAPYNNGSDVNVSLYNNINDNVVNELKSIGFNNINYVDVNTTYDPNIYTGADDVHPNTDGFINIYNSFITASSYEIYKGTNLYNNISSNGVNVYNRAISLASDGVVNATVIPSSGRLNLTIDTWNTTGDYRKLWNESSTNASVTTQHTIGDLPLGRFINISVDGVVYGSYQSNITGYITFTYSGGYSEHQFEADISESTLSRITLTAVTTGSAGNSITTTETVENASFGAGTLTGGTEGSQWNNSVNPNITTGNDLWETLGTILKTTAFITVLGGVFMTIKGFKSHSAPTAIFGITMVGFSIIILVILYTIIPVVGSQLDISTPIPGKTNANGVLTFTGNATDTSLVNISSYTFEYDTNDAYTAGRIQVNVTAQDDGTVDQTVAVTNLTAAINGNASVSALVSAVSS